MKLDKVKGSCLCQKYQFTISGDFHCFMLCHCSRCQKASGSAHASNLFLKKAAIDWNSEAKTPTTYEHPNCRFARAFCESCGSALPKAMDHDSAIQCPAGSLDGHPNIPPTGHIFYKSRANWYDLMLQAPIFDELPK